MQLNNVGERVMNRGSARWLIGTVVLLFPLLLASCNNRDMAVNAQNRIGTPPPGATPQSVKLSDVVNDPAKFTNQVVTVSGEVNHVLGPKAFTIGGDGFIPPGELLVVSRNGFPSIPDRPDREFLVDGDIVQVTGTVRTFVVTEIARDVDAPMEGETYAHWEGKPVLVVSNMVTTPRAHGGSGGKSAQASAGDRTPIKDVVVIVTTPARESLAGKTVQLTGVRVQSVVSDKGFWIGPSADQRLFVRLDEQPTPGTPTEGKVDVNPGQTISVTGILKKIPPMTAVQKQWGMSAGEATALKNEPIYLNAEHVQVQQK